MAENHDDVIASFCDITGQDERTASQYLSANKWNLEAAAQSFLEDQEPEAEGKEDPYAVPSTSDPNWVPPELPPLPPVASSSSSTTRRPPQQKKKFATFRDLADNGSDGHSHGDDDDSDKEQQYFAGGDKSGLAVQDPGQGSRDHIRRILETARRNGPLPRPEEEQSQTAFRGAGVTLGGDDVPSAVVPDPNANQAPALPMAERTLHLWQDGFSVDDGPLFRYDDPANARTLEMINRGSAPLDLMNVENGQAVDVKLEQHQNEKYVQPTKKYKPFQGSGQRLGNPMSTPVTTSTSTSAQPASASTTTSSTAAASSTAPPAVEGLDESQPVVTLQIRLADGSRLPSRFNATHTVGDVYSTVDRASPSSASRPYSLATTFPTKELSDKSQQIGQLAELKRGGVVVQKWT